MRRSSSLSLVRGTGQELGQDINSLAVCMDAAHKATRALQQASRCRRRVSKKGGRFGSLAQQALLPVRPPPPDAGAKVVVGHQAFGEMALHFLEKYGMMAIKVPSKFDLRRLCRATGEPRRCCCPRACACATTRAHECLAAGSGSSRCRVKTRRVARGVCGTVRKSSMLLSPTRHLTTCRQKQHVSWAPVSEAT